MSPAEMVTVPREPTDNMLTAAMIHSSVTKQKMAYECWLAMIAAASPAAPSDEVARLKADIESYKHHCTDEFMEGYSVATKDHAAEMAERCEELAKTREALAGLLREFEKFSRYGSALAMTTNPAVMAARAALGSAEP